VNDMAGLFLYIHTYTGYTKSCAALPLLERVFPFNDCLCWFIDAIACQLIYMNKAVYYIYIYINIYVLFNMCYLDRVRCELYYI
jgi:hypothetical protein